jgi:hypothetical protein
MTTRRETHIRHFKTDYRLLKSSMHVMQEENKICYRDKPRTIGTGGNSRRSTTPPSHPQAKDSNHPDAAAHTPTARTLRSECRSGGAPAPHSACFPTFAPSLVSSPARDHARDSPAPPFPLQTNCSKNVMRVGRIRHQVSPARASVSFSTSPFAPSEIHYQ